MVKLLPIVMLGVLIVSAFGASVTASTKNQGSTGRNVAAISPYVDELDQSMTDYDGTLPLGYANLGSWVNLSIAQSFIPQKEVLTRVQFFMGRNASTVSPCVLAVRENLTGANLAMISLDPAAFPLVNGSPTEEQLAWVTFNFSDIWVTPGQTYYMVVYTTFAVNNFYWVSGNGSNMYLNGTVYLSTDNGVTWSEFTNADGCFKTYGLREAFLSITPKGGLFGASFTVKNIGNVTAWDVSMNVSVNGGIFGLIHSQHLIEVQELAPNAEAQVMTGTLFGLGSITMSLTVQGANVREMSKEVTAKIFLIYIKI